MNDKYFNGTGPVFIMIEGEGIANPKWMNIGTWIKIAKIHV